MPSPRPLSQMTLGNPVVCTPRPSKTLAIQLVAVIAFGRHAVHIITIRGSAAGDVGERYGTSSSALYPKTQLRVTRLLPAVTSAAGIRGRQTWLLPRRRKVRTKLWISLTNPQAALWSSFAWRTQRDRDHPQVGRDRLIEIHSKTDARKRLRYGRDHVNVVVRHCRLKWEADGPPLVPLSEFSASLSLSAWRAGVEENALHNPAVAPCNWGWDVDAVRFAA